MKLMFSLDVGPRLAIHYYYSILTRQDEQAGGKRKNKEQKSKCIDRVEEPMRSFTINHWALLKEKHMFAVLAHASACRVNYTVITQHTSLSRLRGTS